MEADPFEFQCDDGASLHVHHWVGEAPARAAVIILHGMAEHGLRYEPLAERLTEVGIEVYVPDLRGHGQTASEEDLGHLADRDGWTRILDDVRALSAHVKSERDGLPIVLLGHSMGSFMVQQLLFESPDDIAGAVLSGTDGKVGVMGTLGRLVARLERRRVGRRGKSMLIHKLSFDAFNKPFKPARTDFDWLSRDPEAVDKYVDDPLCGFVCTVQTWFDFLGGLLTIAKPGNIARIPKEMPIYVFSGSEDPVGKRTKGVKRLLRAYDRAGLQNVSHRFYAEGRHEMFNEINRDEVIDDLIDWIEGIV